MAFTTPVFPALPSGRNMDSQKYAFSRADAGMRAEIEGGYVITRARFTRRPPLIFKIGFTNITEADKDALDTFTGDVGTFRSFNWTNIANGIEYRVRLKGMPEFVQRGIGLTKLWDCSMELEQV